jgi:hypothetical protein
MITESSDSLEEVYRPIAQPVIVSHPLHGALDLECFCVASKAGVGKNTALDVVVSPGKEEDVATIYISSTFLDLKECRQAVYDVLRKLQQDVIAMEDYVATDQRPVEKCRDDVATRCDVYLGIAAFRYGYVPETHNPDAYSVTQLEYETAKARNKPRLLFLLDDNAPWSPAQVDKGQASERLERMRAAWKQDRLCAHFRTPEDLATQVSVAVSRHLSEVALPTSTGSLSALVQDLSLEMMSMPSDEIPGSAASTIENQIQDAFHAAEPTKLLRVDLGAGTSWWSTRLLLLTELVLDFTQIEQFVFLKDDKFEGMASPLAIRRALMKLHPDLLGAYHASVKGTDLGALAAMMKRFQDIMVEVTSNPNWEETAKQFVTKEHLRAWGVDVSTEAIQSGAPNAVWLLKLLEHSAPFVAIVRGQEVESVIDCQKLAASLALTLMTDHVEQAMRLG